MNSNNLLELLQTGFRASLGATASFVETLQDPQKREESLAQFQSDFNQQVTEWAEKGETTELEARRFIEQMWNQPGNPVGTPTTGTSSDPAAASSSNPVQSNAQDDIEELTTQLADLRKELEELRKSDSNS
ncbi:MULTISPECIES: hypothetical protein [Moorena]|uniref:Uncharacterized protein n=2 Tax=Moorena producens TaxID=1155739 RepID=A0A1D9G776_MOOP1|nr:MULTISPECIES: hypothetical protein [Moorena]NEQ14200.1 hypothetical protein [Moorena sp. SIO3E2]AOY83499.1 hypothetical protein BJP36_29860 [Moorena producens JHB]EGJ34638.1 hypothetical protein LYNGBM3L_14380 [Moorena producens 3L]NEP30427.1 hypothetical protein [Moorena sp. SIO3B2]NEP65340.1 hypothetical protein [Moorena sp. SIO3A5]